MIVEDMRRSSLFKNVRLCKIGYFKKRGETIYKKISISVGRKLRILKNVCLKIYNTVI